MLLPDLSRELVLPCIERRTGTAAGVHTGFLTHTVQQPTLSRKPGNPFSSLIYVVFSWTSHTFILFIQYIVHTGFLTHTVHQPTLSGKPTESVFFANPHHSSVVFRWTSHTNMLIIQYFTIIHHHREDNFLHVVLID